MGRALAKRDTSAVKIKHQRNVRFTFSGTRTPGLLRIMSYLEYAGQISVSSGPDEMQRNKQNVCMEHTECKTNTFWKLLCHLQDKNSKTLTQR